MSSKLPREFRIVKYDNAQIIRSHYPFDYESFDTPGLRTLREKYELDKVVSKRKSEFGQMVALRNWVRSRWDFGRSYVQHKPFIPALNALSILEAAEKGIRFHCAYTSVVYIQCALSLGFQARGLLIRKDCSGIPISQLPGKPTGHRVAEIWSNDLRKWIVMDPDYNLHYVAENVPLSGCEIRQACLSGKRNRVQWVQGKPLPSQKTKPGIHTSADVQSFSVTYKAKVLNKYDQIAVEMNNNWMSSGQPNQFVGLADVKVLPVLALVSAIRNITWTQNVNDLYWTLNQAQVHLKCAGKSAVPIPVLDVSLETQTPNFDKYLVKTDDGPWRRSKERFRWRLKKGTNTIRAKPVNKYGREGITSTITVRYKGIPVCSK